MLEFVKTLLGCLLGFPLIKGVIKSPWQKSVGNAFFVYCHMYIFLFNLEKTNCENEYWMKDEFFILICDYYFKAHKYFVTVLPSTVRWAGALIGLL